MKRVKTLPGGGGMKGIGGGGMPDGGMGGGGMVVGAPGAAAAVGGVIEWGGGGIGLGIDGTVTHSLHIK